MKFLEWVDYEGGIWEMVMHGWSEDQLDDCGLTQSQKEDLEAIALRINEADAMWQDLQRELEDA